MSDRKPLGKKLRFEVFKRDGFVCVYCGAHPPAAILHCEHVIPVAAGGPDDIDNLVTACDACNLGKGARLLHAVPLTVEQKAEQLHEREDQIRAFNDLILAKRERIERTAWVVAEVLMEAWSKDTIRKDWFSSIERFVDLLDLSDMIEAANIATRKFARSKNQCFAYFCGICWRKVRGESR